MSGFSEYTKHDATGLAELVRRKEVKPIELVEAAIAEIEARNPKLNAVVVRWYDEARREAESPPEGPFCGVPFLVKDLLSHVKGRRLCSASRFHAEHVSSFDSEYVKRIRRAGLILLGRTNCPELGLLGHTAPALHGVCRNPWNTEHTPGGSSGGAAAAVAAGMVPMAAGGDGGGSIRIPGSACNLFGLKPTRGRTPLGPEVGEDWNGWVVQHVMTRSVRDSAAFLDATQGPDLGDPYFAPPVERPFIEEVSRPPGKLRVAFHRGSLFGREQHADCAAAVDDAAALLRELGHDVREACPDFDRAALVDAYFVVVCANTASIIDRMAEAIGRPAEASGFEPTTWLLSKIGRRISAGEFVNTLHRVEGQARRVAAFFQDHDVFLTSTLAYPPKRIGEQDIVGKDLIAVKTLNALPIKGLLLKALDQIGSEALEATPNTQLFNQTGQPAMNVPLMRNAAGLPIGVQIAGRFGDEATLLRLAAQLEEARPFGLAPR